MFNNFNVNLPKNEGFLTSIPCIPILEYSQSNGPLVTKWHPIFRITLTFLIREGQGSIGKQTLGTRVKSRGGVKGVHPFKINPVPGALGEGNSGLP